MKLLTAYVGTWPDDFAYTIPGELVYLGFVCDRDYQEGRDRGCGCGRAFTGLASGKSTTVAIVAEVDTTREELTAIVADMQQRHRWPADTNPRDLADELVRDAEQHPAGTLLRRWIDDLTEVS